MRNIIRTALVIGTLATPMIAMADDAKKDMPAKTDAKDTKDAKDAKAPAKKDAKAPAKKDTAKDAKDAKDPAAK
jgi:hypothetical protein